MARTASRLLSAAALLFGALLGVYAAGPALGSGPVRTLDILARQLPLNPQDEGASRVGRLQYLGGLSLRASNRGFGGISGMIFEEGCRRFLAVTDTGSWIVLEPVEEAGRLVDVQAGWIAPILNMEGKPPASKFVADVEEVARAENGDVFISYEQRHRIERFQGISACSPETLEKASVASHRLPETAGWPRNGGIEAFTVSGRELLILSEGAPAGKGGRQGLGWLPGAPARPFSWQLPAPGYEPTAMDMFRGDDDNTHILVLHRRASLLGGLSAIVTEAVLDPETGLPGEGRIVARLRSPMTVDNMEALAIRREAGRIFVYLASDDNFTRLQRTLLLKFELLPEGGR